MQKNYENLIVGAGITGATLARLLAERGQSVLLIDKRATIAGNCYDYFDKNGQYLQLYGPHIFRTNDDKVWQFLSRFTTWKKYHHKVRVIVNGIEVPLPFNFTSIKKLFCKEKADIFISKLLQNYGENKKISVLELKKSNDKDLQELSAFIYENIFYNYTQKQWGISPENLEEDIFLRVPIYTSDYDGYFTEKYQAIASNGYAKMIENMLNHKNITLQLDTDFKNLKNIKYSRLFYTGSIDEFFDYKYGALPYRSLTFKFESIEKPEYQSVAVVNFPSKESYTRITEFKHFLDNNLSKTNQNFYIKFL